MHHYDHHNPTYNDIYASNRAVIALVGRFIECYMKENGLSYRAMAKRVKCAHMTIYAINKSRMNYCSLTLLSRVAVACGCSLLEWLRAPVPGEREAIEKQAGVFGK